jgi:hypothetical protein
MDMQEYPIEIILSSIGGPIGSPISKPRLEGFVISFTIL